MTAPSARPAEGERGFDEGILPRLRQIPFFRLAGDDEIDASYEAYCSGDFARLCQRWCAVAQPTRADLGRLTRFYDRAGWGPARANGLAFLATVRAVLRAGERMRARLSAHTRAALERDFPWLERRHEHVPDGWTPVFDFPDQFRLFVDAVGVEDARVRWQLCAGLNEVQQQWYSRDAARRFRVPELARHAERERELAVNYFACWAPPATRELWRQTVLILDALNAATFDLVCNRAAAALIWHSTTGMLTRSGRAEWRAFSDGLASPQWVMEP
jgi:hypothetical protein